MDVFAVNPEPKPVDPYVRVDHGWISGGTPDRPLRAVIDPERDLVEVVDGTGPLLSMTFAEAASLADQIRALIATWAATPGT